MEMKSIERIDETSYQQFLSEGVVVIADALIEKIIFHRIQFFRESLLFVIADQKLTYNRMLV